MLLKHAQYFIYNLPEEKLWICASKTLNECDT